jgi:hypothetical protein
MCPHIRDLTDQQHSKPDYYLSSDESPLVLAIPSDDGDGKQTIRIIQIDKNKSDITAVSHNCSIDDIHSKPLEPSEIQLESGGVQTTTHCPSIHVESSCQYFAAAPDESKMVGDNTHVKLDATVAFSTDNETIATTFDISHSVLLGIDDYMQMYPLGPDPTTLATTNSHPLDSTIRFTESNHKYQVDFDGSGFESNSIISVSGLVHSYFPVFDPDDAIQKMMKGRNWHRGNPCYHLTPVQIKEKWNSNATTASTRGTWLHGQLERYMNGFPLPEMPYTHLVPLRQFFQWELTHFKNQLVPFRTEIRFRSGSDLRLTGTADLLAIDPNHPTPDACDGILSLHIIDWKFSKEIKLVNSYQCGLGPCSKMPDCNFSHYTLQQNLYKWLLETQYKVWTWKGHSYTSVRVSSMKLAVFHENHGENGLYLDVPCITDTISQTLSDRRLEVRNLNCSNTPI